MKEYKKIIDGREVIKSAGQIVVRKNGMQTFNPSEAQILADGWEIYERPIYTPTLEDVKRNKVEEILAYDSSEAVNEFTYGGQHLWLNAEKRFKIAERIAMVKAKCVENNEEITETYPMNKLWDDGFSAELPLVLAEKLLNKVVEYASVCYDNTQMHLANVQKLESIEAVEAYDYTRGYPAKLAF